MNVTEEYPIIISPNTTTSSASTIAFISDLHFDFVNGKFSPEQSNLIKESFISYIKEKYSHSIICILGDCFNDWSKTLQFIKELESEKINGFFVLGNHDFWNDGTMGYAELLNIFDAETKNHKYFHLLITGRKYNYGDLCFVGDTGWTSFTQDGKQAELSQFMLLPDSTRIKSFSPNEILTMHNRWINYANTIIQQEKQIIILTHYPMICFAKNPIDTWWSSETELIESKNCWKIFGHTHKKRQRKRNNISSQRGYKNIDILLLNEYKHLTFMKQYKDEDFGLLVKTPETTNLSTINLDPLIEFYNPTIVKNPNTQIELVEEIKHRGFKRSSKNWEILAELAENPYGYIKHIKNLLKDYEKSAYIGYKYVFDLSEKTLLAVHTSIACLENIFDMNDFSNLMIFVMSAIITGYVYNYMPEQIDNMRPVDYYDIVRFYLVFQTMKKFNLGFDDITSIRKHKSRNVHLANVPVGLPSFNGKCLTPEEAYSCLKGIYLLPETKLID